MVGPGAGCTCAVGSIHTSGCIDSVQHALPCCIPLLLIATVHCNNLPRSPSRCACVYLCCFRGTCPLVLPPPRPGRPLAGRALLCAPPWTGERARVLSTLFRPTTPRRIRYPGSCARGHSASRHLQGRAAKQHPLASHGTVSASAFLLAGNWARRPTRPCIGSRLHLVTRCSERLNAR